MSTATIITRIIKGELRKAMSTNTDNKCEFENVKALKYSDSGKALLCCGLHPTSDTWVPVSQLHEDSEVFEPGHEGTLVVSLWWATQAKLV